VVDRALVAAKIAAVRDATSDLGDLDSFCSTLAGRALS
jgi:hypothetical protein